MTVISVIIAIILLISVPIMAMRLINGISRRASIQEEAYLELNGIKQFVRIRCEDGANPVMIFIHVGLLLRWGMFPHIFIGNWKVISR